jgi:hypothetical protein
MQARHHFAEAERIYRKILPSYPPSMLFFDNLITVVAAQHRRKEVIPILEDWYLHADSNTRAMLKKRTNLDFKRLDAMLRP